MKNYVVLRIANKQDGTTVVPVKTFETEVEGTKEFYRSCAAAVDSDNLTDSVTLLTKDGFVLDNKSFTHAPAPAPEPEPEEES